MTAAQTRPTYTPGPWEAHNGLGTIAAGIWREEPTRYRAVLTYGSIRPSDEDARLIAAAPEMLEALRALVASDVTPPTPPDYATRGYRSFTPEQGRLIDRQNEARALIQRVEGGE